MLIQHVPASGESAWFRAQHPRSWWWTPHTDILALILQALQGANWQRGGGKGQPPQRLERPDDKPPAVRSGDELRGRRAAMDAELARRRARRQQRQRREA